LWVVVLSMTVSAAASGTVVGETFRISPRVDLLIDRLVL